MKYVLDVARAIELGLLTVFEERKDAKAAGDVANGGETTDEEKWEEFMNILPDSEKGRAGQRGLLRYVQQRPEGTDVAEMAEHFGETGMSIGGTLNGGVQRNIDRAGFATREPILKFVQERGKWRIYPGELLLRMPPVPL